MREKNLYQIMGLDAGRCTTSQIKNRYRQLVKLYHPDLKGNETKMIEINQAYEILSNPIKRLKYDQLLKTKITPQTQQYNHKTKTSPIITKSVQPNLSNLIFKIKLGFYLICLTLIILIGLRFVQLNNQVIVDQYPINFINTSYSLTNTFQQKSFKIIKLIKMTKQSSNQSINFPSSPPANKQQCQSKNFIVNPAKFFKSIFNDNQC